MQMRKKGGAAAYNGREVPQARWVGCLGVQAVRGFLHVCTCAKWGHGAVRSGWAGGAGRMVTGGWGANLVCRQGGRVDPVYAAATHGRLPHWERGARDGLG